MSGPSRPLARTPERAFSTFVLVVAGPPLLEERAARPPSGCLFSPFGVNLGVGLPLRGASVSTRLTPRDSIDSIAESRSSSRCEVFAIVATVWFTFSCDSIAKAWEDTMVTCDITLRAGSGLAFIGELALVDLSLAALLLATDPKCTRP